MLYFQQCAHITLARHARIHNGKLNYLNIICMYTKYLQVDRENFHRTGGSKEIDWNCSRKYVAPGSLLSSKINSKGGNFVSSSFLKCFSFEIFAARYSFQNQYFCRNEDDIKNTYSK